MKRTKEEAEKTRKVLLDTAMKEFLETGFYESKLEVIAKKAKVTRGAIYWHFKDKNDLLEQLIKYKDIESIKISEEIYRSNLPPLKKLKNILYLGMPALKSKKLQKNYIRLKVEFYNYFIKHGDKRKISNNFLDKCSALLKEAIIRGEVKKNVNPYIAAATLLSIGAGLYIRHNVMPENLKDISKLRILIDNYIKLIQRNEK